MKSEVYKTRSKARFSEWRESRRRELLAAINREFPPDVGRETLFLAFAKKLFQI